MERAPPSVAISLDSFKAERHLRSLLDSSKAPLIEKTLIAKRLDRVFVDKAIFHPDDVTPFSAPICRSTYASTKHLLEQHFTRCGSRHQEVFNFWCVKAGVIHAETQQELKLSTLEV